METIVIEGISEDLTKVIIDGEEVTPEENIIYQIGEDGDKYIYNGTTLELYEEDPTVVIIEGISEDLTKVIIDGEEVEPEENVIYQIGEDGDKYIYNGTTLEPYEEPAPEITIFDPSATFSSTGKYLTLVLDNTNNDYDDIIPHIFLSSLSTEYIDCGNGLVITKSYEMDENYNTHTLYTFKITRTNNPRGIDYL